MFHHPYSISVCTVFSDIRSKICRPAYPGHLLSRGNRSVDPRRRLHYRLFHQNRRLSVAFYPLVSNRYSVQHLEGRQFSVGARILAQGPHGLCRRGRPYFHTRPLPASDEFDCLRDWCPGFNKPSARRHKSGPALTGYEWEIFQSERSCPGSTNGAAVLGVHGAQPEPDAFSSADSAGVYRASDLRAGENWLARWIRCVLCLAAECTLERLAPDQDQTHNYRWLAVYICCSCLAEEFTDQVRNYKQSRVAHGRPNRFRSR